MSHLASTFWKPRTFEEYVDAYEQELLEAYDQAATQQSFVSFAATKWAEYKEGPQ